ncbi:putative mRNA (2'-O-methyladenosine-N(6)-)-methyltransferase [Dioscorea sansibarensis]
MDAQTAMDSDDPSTLKEMRTQLEEAIQARRLSQHALIASLQNLVPDLVSSLDLSLRLISAINHRPFSPTPSPSDPQPLTPRRRPHPDSHPLSRSRPKLSSSEPHSQSPTSPSSDRLALVRSAVAVCLLDLVPFVELDSAALLRRLESGSSSVSPTDLAAIAELGGDLGPVSAVETALRCIAAETGAVQLEEFSLSGKSMLMVWSIDRHKLAKELPENLQHPPTPAPSSTVQETVNLNEGSNHSQASPMVPRGPPVPPEMWMRTPDHQMAGLSPMFPGGGAAARGMSLMGPRTMFSPHARTLMGPMGGPSPVQPKMKSDDEELKDLEMLLNKKTFRELQKSKTGEELLDLIHRPTARETAVHAKFKTKGGSQLKMYCLHLTKEDCRRQNGSFIACDKVHYKRIIAPHTDTNLGDCSFLDTCRHTKTCKYVHYEYDPTPDLPPMMMGAGNLPPKPIKPQRAEYCSEVELGEPQWINCDIRNFRMDILGQFGVIMADPPWDIHMELPYGTMADDEMRNLNVPALQTDGLIFLWVTGRAMELGRECLELWGYKRVEEIIWVKTNQLQRIIRTGRTGHWLNHSKEHCLVGIKGNPEVNRNIDTDVIVAEVRETSRKPDEMYPLLERISPRTRKLELFARMHNTHAGWLSLGNQLNGVRLVDDGLRARFKAAYPDVEVQPPSPPRATSTMDSDLNHSQIRSPFVAADTKEQLSQSGEPTPSNELDNAS